MEETERRIYAACQRFQITPEDVGDRLYVDSGREQPCVIAEDLGQGARIIRPIADDVIEQIKARGIDVLILAPFISSHNLSANDNPGMAPVRSEEHPTDIQQL